MISPQLDFTAWFVMQGTIAAMHQPQWQSQANDNALSFMLPLAEEAKKSRPISRLIHALPYKLQYCIGDMVTNRGRLRHFYLRKKEIEAQALALLAKGDITQVIVLGAGMDVLSLRLSKTYPEIKFIEIDLPESQLFKANALATHQIEYPKNSELISGDLRNPLKDILAASTLYDPQVKTLWIAEGLLMFIPEDSVLRITKEIKERSAADSYFIFTTLPTIKQTTILAYLLQSFYLKKENCPYEWVIPFTQVKEFMHNAGYELINQKDFSDLHRDYIGCQAGVLGEAVHIAQIGSE